MEMYPDPENVGQQIQPSPPGAMEKFIDFFGQDFNQMDPQEIEQSFGVGGQMPVLGHSEKVWAWIVQKAITY